MARPATGQTPVVTFRPPQAVRDDFDARAQTAKRDRSDALIEAMHDWIAKQNRTRGTTYLTTSESERYHATAACPKFRGGRSAGDERHPIIGLTPDQARAAKQTACPECVASTCGASNHSDRCELPAGHEGRHKDGNMSWPAGVERPVNPPRTPAPPAPEEN